MKTIQKYQCEVCGEEYAVRDDATNCENWHKIPQAIVRVQHIPRDIRNTGYPVAVTVRMSDGKEVVYKR